MCCNIFWGEFYVEITTKSDRKLLVLTAKSDQVDPLCFLQFSLAMNAHQMSKLLKPLSFNFNSNKMTNR